MSNLTQHKLFIGDDKKNTLFGVTFSFKLSLMQSTVSFMLNENTLPNVILLQAKPPGRSGVTAGTEDGRLKQMNDYKKKISHLKNIDSKLADHILDEIIER